MTAPRSLRARIVLAAVAALALAYLLAGVLLIEGVESDGRDAVDRELRDRAEQLLRRPPPPSELSEAPVPAPRIGRRSIPVPPPGDRLVPGPGGGPGAGDGPGGGPGPGAPPEERLLAGSGSFVQVAVRGQVVARRGDVPADAPPVPATGGLTTVRIGESDWRSLTTTLGPRRNVRVQILSSLAEVEDRVASTRRLVVLLGLAALTTTALLAWAFTSLAVRPLERLRTGAERVSGTREETTSLPDDDGPDEVRALARTLNEMLARLRASTDAMERALQGTRRFAADAGHELRTPLTAMRADLDTLERNPHLPSDERRALVAELTAEHERIVHLLEGLQALARGDAAESLPREDVELGDLVDAAVYAARRRHPEVRYELEDRAGGATVSGWGSGLRLLVDNLLDNAALHGNPAGRVDVGLEREEGRLVLRVEDDGPGVPAEERGRVVEPFARGGAATASGTGLGLAIVAQQAELHGGELRLGESRLGGLAVSVPLAADTLPPDG